MNYMGIEIDECVERTVLKNKLTVVIPTFQGSIKNLMLSVFSYLLYPEDRKTMEHICVCIHGPDSRTGDPTLQDQKQAFLAELRDDFNSPLTVIRAWSRVGDAEAVGMALNWVHTDGYVVTRDDIAVREGWTSEVKNKFYNEDKIAIASWGKLIATNFGYFVHRGMHTFQPPDLNTSFLVCKKKWLLKVGAKWNSMMIPNDDNYLQFKIEDLDKEELTRFYNSIGMDVKLPDEFFNYIKHGVGSWIFYRLHNLGCQFSELDNNIALPLSEDSEDKVSLEKAIENSAYADLYRKYL